MSLMQTLSSPDTWLLVAPPSAVPSLTSLIDAHRMRRPVRILTPDDNWIDSLNDVQGALLVGDRRHTPRTALPGPFITTFKGRQVPVGWLPFTTTTQLECFSNAAAEVQQRSETGGPVALLGQWDDSVTRTVQRAIKLLTSKEESPTIPVYWWTADRIIRRDLLCALRIGLGFVLYSGHGRPYGWAGYHGLHSRHLIHAQGNPSGAILSLTCHTANRYRVSLSFAEHIPLMGIAAAVLGGVRPTPTLDNWWWGNSLCDAFAENPSTTIGELIIRACPPERRHWSNYRIIGDPLAPLIGHPQAIEACEKIWAPAPDESPVPPDYLMAQNVM